MSNNRNPYMNMNQNTRSMNMRGNCGCSGNTAPAAANVYSQRSTQSDCGCAGNTAPAAANSCTQRPVQNDCGCAGNTAPAAANVYSQHSTQSDCGCAGNTAPAAANAYAQRSTQSDCGCAGNTAPAAANVYTQRSTQSDCGCAGNSGFARVPEMPTGDRLILLKYIDEVSFGAYEAALYLDTHPDCQNGMQYFREVNEKRNLALTEYAKHYGPLTLQYAGENCETCWQWVNQPWPWEGGNY